jgi:3'-5' exoribonuclease
MSLFDGLKKVYIKDLEVGLPVENYYRVIGIDKRTKRDGNIFLSLELMDKTGKIQAKVWDNATNFHKMLVPGDIYLFKGVVNEYMKKKEIKVDDIKPTTSKDKNFDENDFIEKPEFDTNLMFEKMVETLRKNINNKFLLQLVDQFSAAYGGKFKIHYGAQKIHHAFIGGLLQHTYSVIKLAISIANHYSLDKELLLIGALFHDIGKMEEFKISPSPETTVEGGLIGHIVIGNNIFIELKNKIPGFPDELSYRIQHLIISHHGEKEFGSPEVPKTAEAYALHIIDLLDSKLKIFDETLQKVESKANFTDYVHFLNRRLYIPSPGGDEPEKDEDKKE